MLIFLSVFLFYSLYIKHQIEVPIHTLNSKWLPLDIQSSNMTQAQRLLDDIHAFSLQSSINDKEHLTHYLKYHLHSREKSHYYDSIVRALEQADRPQFLEVVSFVAYIQEIDPDFDRMLKPAKEKALERGINNVNGLLDQKVAELLLTEMGKLVSPQKYCELMHKISRLSDNQGSEPKQILTLLALLEKKVSWQIWKRRQFLPDYERQTFGIMNEVLSNMRELTYLDNPSIIEGKMKLIKKILQFFVISLKGRTWKVAPIVDRIALEKQIILGQVELFFKSTTPNIKLKFELNDACVQVFGIFNDSYLSQIVNKSTNKYNISQETFLDLITTIMSKPDKNRIIIKETATKLLNDICDRILDVKKGNVTENYRVISKMSDVMIELSKEYVVDLTKNIVRQLQNWNTKAWQQLFLSALLFLFDFKMPEKVANLFDEQSKKIYAHNNKYQESYYNFLKQFGRTDLTVAQVGFDPEKSDEVIPWQLLTLRLSILLNYQWLHQINLLSGIFTNLIKYILNNIYNQQCSEIALMIIREAQRNKDIIHQNQYNKYWLRSVNLITVISQIINSSQQKQLPTNKSLLLLYKVLSSLKQNDELMGCEGLSLFLRVTHLLGIIITQHGRKDSEYLDICIKLMRISLPFSADNFCKNQLQKCLEMLDYLIRVNLSTTFIDIFMELIYISLPKTEIADIVLSNYPFQSIKDKQFSIKNKYQEHRFEILSFMLHRLELEREQTLNDCWRTFSEALHQSQHELCLFLAKIFAYFFKQMTASKADHCDSGNYRLFLKEQIMDATNYCKQIANKINKTTLIHEIICLFQTFQAFQTYLLDLIVAYHKINPTAELNFLKIVEQYSSEVIARFCEQKWMLIIQQNKHQTSLKKVFVCNYFLQLMLLATSSNGHPSRPGSYHRQSKIIKKFAWIQNILGQEDRPLTTQMKRILMNVLLPTAELQRSSGQ